MGEVYRATDTNLRRPVAIKVLPEPSRTIEIALPGFDAKPSRAALNHPNIAADLRTRKVGWRSRARHGVSRRDNAR